MIEGVIAFFEALPAFIQLLSQVGLVIKKIVETAQTNNLNDWLTDLEKTVDQLKEAKTSKEKSDAAQKIVNTISTLTIG